jgi:hypothetical protein
VAVRARPLVAKERLERARECLAYPSNAPNAVRLGQNRLFRFDDAFDPTASQSEVYDQLVRPLVESCFNGYNATVLAYGQTGSGKTYTMGSSGDADTYSDEDAGIIPRVASDIFLRRRQKHEEGTSRVLVRCAFLEVINEEVRDLLHPDASSKSIHIRERGDGAIVVSGIREETTETLDEMIRLLESGCVSRTTGGTNMNARSSRSHAIFTIIIEQTHLTSEAKRTHGGGYSCAKFHLVDLAGSERNKKTKAVGTRFQESININSGLLALGNVIAALSGDDVNRNQNADALFNANVGRRHVPYRDSKLTRLLQDSLGGNAKTCVVACVSPVDSNFEETLNTLKYAQRARNIKNTPKVNRDIANARLATPSCRSFEPGGAAVPASAARGASAFAEGGRAPAADDSELERLALASDLKRWITRAQFAEETSARFAGERDAALCALKTLEGNVAEVSRLASAVASEENMSAAGLARIKKAFVARLERTDEPSVGTPRTTRLVSGVPFPSPAEGYLRELRDLKAAAAAAHAAAAAKDAALAEARDDLRRDESLFAEKMREIKYLRRVAKETSKENERLRMIVASSNVSSSACSARAEFDTLVSDSLARHASGGAPRATLGADQPRVRLQGEKTETEMERVKLNSEPALGPSAFRKEKKSFERRLRESASLVSSKEHLTMDSTKNARDAGNQPPFSFRSEDRARGREEERAAKEAEAARSRSESEHALETRSGNGTRIASGSRRRRDDFSENDPASPPTSAGSETRPPESESLEMKSTRDSLRRELRERESKYSTAAGARAKASGESPRSGTIAAVPSNEATRIASFRTKPEAVEVARRAIDRLDGRSSRTADDASSEGFAMRLVSSSPVDVAAVRALVDAETTAALAAREFAEERNRLETRKRSVVSERAAALRRRDALELKMARKGGTADERDARASDALIERLDGLDAELEFFENALQELLATAAGAAGGAGAAAGGTLPEDVSETLRFARVAENMNPSEVRVAAAVAMERCLRIGLREKAVEKIANGLEMQLLDAQAAIEEMERCSRARESEFQRKVTELSLERGWREAGAALLSERVSASSAPRADPEAVHLSFATSGSSMPPAVAETRERNRSLERTVRRLERERADLERRLASSWRGVTGDGYFIADDDRVTYAFDDDDDDAGSVAAEDDVDSHPALPSRPALPATPQSAGKVFFVEDSRFVPSTGGGDLGSPRPALFSYPGMGASAQGRRDAGAFRKPNAA